MMDTDLAALLMTLVLMCPSLPCYAIFQVRNRARTREQEGKEKKEGRGEKQGWENQVPKFTQWGEHKHSCLLACPLFSLADSPWIDAEGPEAGSSVVRTNSNSKGFTTSETKLYLERNIGDKKTDMGYNFHDLGLSVSLGFEVKFSRKYGELLYSPSEIANLCSINLNFLSQEVDLSVRGTEEPSVSCEGKYLSPLIPSPPSFNAPLPPCPMLPSPFSPLPPLALSPKVLLHTWAGMDGWMDSSLTNAGKERGREGEGGQCDQIWRNEKRQIQYEAKYNLKPNGVVPIHYEYTCLILVNFTEPINTKRLSKAWLKKINVRFEKLNKFIVHFVLFLHQQSLFS